MRAVDRDDLVADEDLATAGCGGWEVVQGEEASAEEDEEEKVMPHAIVIEDAGTCAGTVVERWCCVGVGVENGREMEASRGSSSRAS